MFIEEISQEIYDNLRNENTYVYTLAKFNQLNKYKIDEIKYLLFKDTKPRFILCVGIRDKIMLCPFSAPFGAFINIKKDSSIKQYDAALKALDEYALFNNYALIRFILPPNFYDENEINCAINALYRAQYSIRYIDINFQFNLKNLTIEQYRQQLPRNSRKNLNISLRKNLIFKECKTDFDKAEAYKIIKKNREEKGYCLKMNYNQIFETSQIIKSDFFLIEYEKKNIASAIAFHVKKDIVQIIYWGDISGYSEYKPMNFLSYNLFLFYKELGISYLDIGPSSEEGIPNYGLCNFKSSLGCEISNKFTFEKNFNAKSYSNV